MATFAFDGKAETRWASLPTDAQWVYVDLGSSFNINKVVLNWETAYGKGYEIQASNDLQTWTKIYGTTAGTGGKETLTTTGAGRYVRFLGTVRGTGYGYSLWDFEVYGTPVVVSAGNIALNRPAVSSSNEGEGLAATYAVDGKPGTRWASLATDAQWIYVDLGSSRAISGVVLQWETAYGKAYNIQTSNDANQWTTIKSITDGNGGFDDVPVTGTGRYVRIQGVTRGTGYGYSLWDFEVY